jgi:hypothetical protein
MSIKDQQALDALSIQDNTELFYKRIPAISHITKHEMMRNENYPLDELFPNLALN